MAIPADLAFSDSSHHVVHLARVDECGIKVSVATDAVVHDDLVGSFAWTWCLTFAVSDKLGYVVQTVSSLEEVLASDVLVRYMAVVAGSIASMARMVPGSIVGRHDVAVDTCRRIIAQIAMRSQYVQKE